MMRIKKFTGPNIAQSLLLAKAEMGEDALCHGVQVARGDAWRDFRLHGIEDRLHDLVCSPYSLDLRPVP